MSNSKEWREANKDKTHEYAKRYYETHKKQIREKQKEYFEKKKAECPTYVHDLYMKNHDAIRAYQKKYYEKNKDVIREKYAHHRKAWNEAHKAYLNEHALLAKEIRNAGTRGNVTIPAIIKKEYLRELHAKGLV